jgi:hypothetical protein
VNLLPQVNANASFICKVIKTFREDAPMLTLEDCLAHCDLTEEEILAIAEHENLSEMAAIALGHYMIHQKEGAQAVFKVIVDDIRAAQGRGDTEHVRNLLHVLHHFIRAHPESAPKVHPWHKVM